MKLEQQVCSLELSKKLKELGVKQESLFYWSNCCEKEFTLECSLWHDKETGEWGNGHTLEDVETKYSAFTVAELGNILDEALREDLLKAYGHVVGAIDTKIITPLGLAICIQKPDVCARLLIYLLENKLIPKYE